MARQENLAWRTGYRRAGQGKKVHLEKLTQIRKNWEDEDLKRKQARKGDPELTNGETSEPKQERPRGLGEIQQLHDQGSPQYRTTIAQEVEAGKAEGNGYIRAEEERNRRKEKRKAFAADQEMDEDGPEETFNLDEDIKEDNPDTNDKLLNDQKNSTRRRASCMS